jgi:hypothetical protein
VIVSANPAANKHSKPATMNVGRELGMGEASAERDVIGEYLTGSLSPRRPAIRAAKNFAA